MSRQHSFSIRTRGRGTHDIGTEVQQAVTATGMDCGLAHIFVHHTSASLLLCENADPQVRMDLENFLAHLVPDGSPLFAHQQEGPDDMPAHIRTILTTVDLTLPVSGGRCALGTWQGIYLYEHRTQPHTRKITVTVLG